ncbi:uncharacterized protein [Arachis hypogaea]|uniref:uncharacterized protein n=1 Tax=Arachis hypogaea TaxID=3818 RepID=UPI003B2111CF
MKQTLEASTTVASRSLTVAGRRLTAAGRSLTVAGRRLVVVTIIEERSSASGLLFSTSLAMEQLQNDQQQQHNAVQESQTGSFRGKSDPTWKYFTVKYDKNHKIVDAFDVIKTANALFSLFADVIEWVEPSNIVHVVTDNATNYVSAEKLIHEKYPNIFWSPCAAYCINFILKDIASIPHIADLASRASKVIVFVYNHMILLSWLRKRKGWTEIVRTGVTRFATVFITLKSIYDYKEDLQVLMVDKYFTSHKLAKSANGKIISSIVLDSKFWQDCVTTVKIVGPLIKLLRLVDTDEKPFLGIVYEVAAMQEIQLYRDCKKSFRRESAKRAASRLEPDEWWRLHDGSAPNLQKMAVCLLHQTSSSSGCERKWSLFEQIYSKRRYRLEHQKLSDIVYVTYNLHLQSRLHRKKRNYDPIDIQSIDTIDFLVMVDENDHEFTNGDVEGIESLIYTDNAMLSYPNDGGDIKVEVDMPDIVIESSNTSFGGISEDAGFGLPVYDGDIGTLNDDYDF